MAHNPEDRKPGKVERVIADLAGRRSVWIAIMALAIGLPLARALNTKLEPPPARVRQIPDFTLINQDHKPFGTEQLRGKLWVANFIFTSCPTVCPRLTNALSKVRKRSKNMNGAIQFISISVDPKHDTPEVLSDYIVKNKARGDWNFLTGNASDIRKLVIDGFRIGMGAHNHPRESAITKDSPIEARAHDEATELLEAAHGQQLVLVDKDLWIRGFYNPDDDGLDRLMHEIILIAGQEGVEIHGLDPTVPFPVRAAESRAVLNK